MSQQSGLAADSPPATDATLLRLVVVSTDHDDILAAHLLAHVLDVERHPLSGSSESVELQRWTRVARGCREYLEPLEASNWWSATRAADHAWADPAYSADPPAVRARLASADRVVEALAHLPAVHRIALALHDVEGLSAPAVAQVMRSSDETALERIRRGRTRIVHALNPHPTSRCWRGLRGVDR